MILFIGVPLQTYFAAPCAQEFSGRICPGWVLPGGRLLPSWLPFSPSRSHLPLPPAPSHSFRLTPPSSLSSWRRGLRCLPDLADLLSQLGPPADGCFLRCTDLPLCAEWQRRQHPRQRRRRRLCPRPPRTLLFPGVRCSFPPFHLKRTIGGKSFAFCTPWEDVPKGKKNSLRIRTLERLRAAWGCKGSARCPGAGALRGHAGASCSCCRCHCSCCCCARAPAGLRCRERRRHPPSICGRLVSGMELSLPSIFTSGSTIGSCWAPEGTLVLLDGRVVLGL
ncbi:Hypothetical predicted protein [Marmota monax]|uniref:Uncharacterized protein n=1 Tax=Marmota monax TaxID=9995 RepID=A0A5E4BGN8_MARMO|nr:Hypothetical predicted protein [Marmota monax]